MENKVVIMPFSVSDLDCISDSLEKDFDDFWNYDILKSELQNTSSIYLCCKLNSEIIGFGGISIILDTAELNNIVIKKEYRGKKYSILLLKSLLDCAKLKGCKKANLEVASNNTVAINLYEKLGFKQVGLRPNYYKNVDALLYTLVF